jgi:plastocyanin
LAATKLGALIAALVTLGLATVIAWAPVAVRSRAGTTHTISMDGTTFKPASLTIVLGDSVMWKNEDPFPHTATATAGAFDSKALTPGQSFTFKPTAKGDYTYKCSLHPTMRGMLHVQ